MKISYVSMKSRASSLISSTKPLTSSLGKLMFHQIQLMRNGLYTFNRDNISFEKVSPIKVYGLPIVIFLVLGSWFGATTAEPEVIEKLTTTERLIVVNQETKFTKDRLIVEIGYMNFKHPEIVYAQSILETGNFTSPIFKENHNMFGMKLPRTRATTAIGEDRGHATFENWKSSLHDYGMYYNAYLRELNEEQYYEFLKKYYAEDPNYIIKVMNLAEKFKRQKTFWHYKDEANKY